jgi:branched-chain amino acid transport system permease protein
MLQEVAQLVVNGILLGGVYALISIGLTLIFGMIEIVNFAHGEFLMLSMYAAYWLFQLWGVDPYISLIVVVPLFFVLGVVMQRAIIQPILDAPPINQVFATVGVSMVLQNTAQVLWKADFRTVETHYRSLTFNVKDLMISFPRVVAFAVSVIIIVLLFLYLGKTYTGKAIRAVSQQRKAAMLVGIDVRRTYRIAFGIGLACVGAAGAVLIPIFYTFPTVGSYFVLVAFVVVVLGGYNSLGGALAGGLIIGVVDTLSGYFLSPHLKEAVYFVIFILLLVFRPTGLFGRE